MKANPNNISILLVDDKPANIVVLENLLEQNNRTLLKAYSGEEALKLVLKGKVDLIILDVHMPEMSGFEVLQVLKTNHRTKDIPIIFLTAELREHDSMMKGFEGGAVDYLFKPINPDLLKAKVNVLLKLQLQKKELLEKNESLQKSDLLINNSADIIGIIETRDLKIVDMNVAFTNTLGYKLDDIRGSSLSLILGTEDRKNIKKYVESKQDKLSFETSVYCKDRTIKWLHWKVVSKNNIWYVNARDITEVKDVEKIRNYLATVVKQSTNAIYIHNNEGQIISWNEGAEKIYGYTEHDALRMKIWNIIPDYLKPETNDVVKQLISGKKIQNLETIRITKLGNLIDVLFSATALNDTESNQLTFAITEKDITREKIAENRIKKLNQDLRKNVTQLEVTNKELESFSYSVSHDLRAPLRAINGYSSILKEELGKDINTDLEHLLDVIQNNAQKMGTLIDDLLSFSRMGRKDMLKSECDMYHIIKTILDEMLVTIKHNAKISVDKLDPCYADSSLIKQVWTNLISNAIKYSSKKKSPKISIGCNTIDDEIVYFIKDNGAGFDMKYVDKVFGVFQRLHSSDEFDGTGVGLAIVQRIVTRHGGRVWVEAAVNKGAKFYFTLPMETTTPN